MDEYIIYIIGTNYITIRAGQLRSFKIFIYRKMLIFWHFLFSEFDCVGFS